MSEDLSAENWLARMAQREVAALGELYDRYAPRVYGLMAHILPSRDAAEEILQEVFVRLWSESPRLSQEGGSVAAWLVVTAREAAVERLRALRRGAPKAGAPAHPGKTEKGSKTGRRRAKVADRVSSGSKSLSGKTEAMKPSSAEEAEAPGRRLLPFAWLPQPKDIAVIDERLVLLHKAINQLPKPQRQALELAVFGGLQESEIAAEMGEPLGKVRSSLRAAVTFVKHRRRAVCGTWAANI